MARTAVIAGTATAVSGSVASKQHARAQNANAQAAAAADSRDQIASLQADMNSLQAQQAQAAVAAAPSTGSNLLEQLQQLVQLRDSGALTEPEFQIAKTKLLNA
jgi:hypothetical protein